jgi:hypothetical protein
VPAKLSIVVALGFIYQRNEERPELGDEFDHFTPLRDAENDVELIIVDRAWPKRWGRVEAACAEFPDRVAYIPPRSTAAIRHGFRAASSMRNSGALVASGDLLAFVDDFCLLDGSVADAVCKHFDDHRQILCPLFHENQEAQIPEGSTQMFSGHSPAVYMCTRDDFVAINGFDENYDGAYGEEDTDFEMRLDTLLFLRGGDRMLRVRKRGLLWRRSWHINGHFPERPKFPWGGINVERAALRCNRAFYRAVALPRAKNNEIEGNYLLSADDAKVLAETPCDPGCSICSREDRPQQVDSYTGVFAPTFSSDAMAGPVEFRSGCFDPWKEDDDNA